MIKYSNCSKITDPSRIENTVLHYFQSIYFTNNSTSVIDRFLTDEEMFQTNLLSYMWEVVQTFKQLKGWKTPGPDRLLACFLQRYWHILGRKITHIVHGSLNNGEVINVVNDTNISLALKIKGPAFLKYYKLVSLSNVIYKLVSKVIS